MSYEEYRIKLKVTLGLSFEPQDVSGLTVTINEAPYLEGRPIEGGLLTSWGDNRAPLSGIITVPIGLWDIRVNTDRETGLDTYWVIIRIISVDGIFNPVVVYTGEVKPDPIFTSFSLLRHSPYIALQTVYEIPPEEEDDLDEPPRTPDEIARTPTLKSSVDAVSENVRRGFTNTFDLLGGIRRAIGDLIGGFFSSLFGNLPELFKATVDESVSSVMQTATDVTGNTPDWKKDLDSTLKPYAQGLVDKALLDLNVKTLGKSPLNMNDAAIALGGIGITVTGLGIGLWLAHSAAEAATLGQYEAIKDIDHMVIAKLGLGALSAKSLNIPLEWLVFKRSNQFYASLFTPEIPQASQLINMVVKEKITLEEFKTNMKYQGFSEEWSQLEWDAHFIAPNFGDIQRAFWRGDWDEETKLAMMKRVDLDPFYNDTVWNMLMYEIPSIGELTNLRVKEVIGKLDYAKGLKFHGYTPEWSERIWDGHFMPPSLGDIMTAYRRGIPVSIPEIDPDTGAPITRDVTSLSIKDVHQLMELVDLDPRYNTIFDTRLYRDPTIREGRYMFETGAMDEEGVKNLVVRTGLDPQYVDEMTHYLTHFAERTYQRRYLTALVTAYVNEVYNEEQMSDLVVKAGFTVGVANWIIEIGKVRKDIADIPKALAKPKILTMSQLDKAYIKDVIDESTYTTRMMLLGYETLDISLKMQILNLDKVVEEDGTRLIRLTTAQLLSVWRFGEMTESDLRIELQLRGLDTISIDRLIKSKIKQWGVISDADREGGVS